MLKIIDALRNQPLPSGAVKPVQWVFFKINEFVH
jgi:hypothetical protein